MVSDEITAEGGQVILRGSYLSTDASKKQQRLKGVLCSMVGVVNSTPSFVRGRVRLCSAISAAEGLFVGGAEIDR